MKDNWDNVFGEVPASFEERMKATLAGLEEKPKIRRFRFPGGGLVAAALAVVILGGTALATNLFGLQSLTVADPYATPAAAGQVIGLQGLPESAEFKANAEWRAYLAEHGTGTDADAADIPAGYELYTVYDEEMAAALQGIADSYKLKLHTSLREFYSENDLYAALGADPFLQNCAALIGDLYEDGSFQASGISTGARRYEYELGRYVKGTFSEVTLNVGDAGEYEEWIYTTASGVDVQLSMGGERCVLLADLEDSFVAVNLLGGTKGSVSMPEPMTREELQAFADMIDFAELN